MVLTRSDLLALLIPGKVFFIKSDRSPDIAHYFVVVNANPDEIKPIILVMATSQVEKRRNYVRLAHLSSETLVYANSDTCEFLRVDSVFDCNSIYDTTFERLLEHLNDGGRTVGDVDREFLTKLRHGVRVSKKVSGQKKGLV